MPSSPPPPRIVVFWRRQPETSNPPCSLKLAIPTFRNSADLRFRSVQMRTISVIVQISIMVPQANQRAGRVGNSRAASWQGKDPPIDRENKTTGRKRDVLSCAARRKDIGKYVQAVWSGRQHRSSCVILGRWFTERPTPGLWKGEGSDTTRPTLEQQAAHLGAQHKHFAISLCGRVLVILRMYSCK